MSALNVTTILGTAALVALSAVTVIVVEPELSDGTVVGDAERVRTAAVAEFEAEEAGAPLPPQLDNKAAIATNNKAVNVLA